MATPNADVLDHIMSFADVGSILACMQTCHAVNHDGARHLLAHPLKVGTDKQVCQLLAFFKPTRAPAEGPYRLRCLRQLTIMPAGEWVPSSYFDSQEGREAIVYLLLHAHNLTRLNVYDVESLLTATPDLAAAIAALKSIRTIELRSVGKLGRKLLQEMQSRLVNVMIDLVRDVDSHSEERDPAFLLSHSASTLEYLEVDSPTACHHATQYPHMWSLRLHGVDTGNLVTSQFVHSYPNLRSLDMRFCSISSDIDFELSDKRKMNMALLRSHGVWKFLTYVCGQIPTLYTLALQCRVRRLAIDYIVWQGSTAQQLDPHFEMLATVLRDTQPSLIEIAIPSVSHLMNTSFTHTFVTVGARRIKCLSIRINPGHEDGHQSVEALLEGLHSLLRKLTLISLRLELLWYGMCRARVAASTRDRTSPPPEEPYPTEAALDRLDIENIADSTFRVSASMKALTVIFTKNYGQDSIIVHRGEPLAYYEMDEFLDASVSEDD